MRLVDLDVIKADLELQMDRTNPNWSWTNEVACYDLLEYLDNFQVVDPVKHASVHRIKSLYCSEGWYTVNECSKCGNCGHGVDDWGQNFCSECGAKLDGEPRFFRQRTRFVEGEDSLVSIPRSEYERAEEWVYEID